MAGVGAPEGRDRDEQEPPPRPAAAPTVDELYPPVDWAALWAKVGAPVDWLCEPLLIAGRAVALFSPAKAGKCLLCLEIAAALATGRAVLGNPAPRSWRGAPPYATVPTAVAPRHA